MAAAGAEKKHWIPLEANPDVFADYARKLLGTDLPGYAFHDVFGLDDELLAMVPQPAKAVLLLFPITKDTEAARAEEKARIEAEGQTVDPGLFYMKQTIGNACGTIGLLHALANNQAALPPAPGSFMEQFVKSTEGMSPADRGGYLERPPAGAPDIDSIHEAAAKEGQTEAPPPDTDVDLHFAAFVESGGCLYELDGRKASPINHGPTSPESLLRDAAAVVRRNFMERSGGSLQFSLVALGPEEE